MRSDRKPRDLVPFGFASPVLQLALKNIKRSRFRRRLAIESLEARRLLIAATHDFGDAPSQYLQIASHFDAGPKLGVVRDTELGTHFSPHAKGDDDANATGDNSTPDDEDGVTWEPIYLAAPASSGNTATITISSPSTSSFYVAAWIDFDRNGTWDANEKVLDRGGRLTGPVLTQVYPLSISPEILQRFSVGQIATGATFARVRVWQTPPMTVSPEGADSTGEVEDYEVVVGNDPGYDFGDAPTVYNTNSASHLAFGPRLGATRDGEFAGQPSLNADGDGNDEDGVTQNGIAFGTIDLASPSTHSFTVDLQNIAMNPAGISEARLSAWIDWNRDGVFDSINPSNGTALPDLVLNREIVSNGTYTFPITVPPGVQPGLTYARFRLSTVQVSDPNNQTYNGEIEDYAVTIRDVVYSQSPLAFNQITYGNIKNSTEGQEWVFNAKANTSASFELIDINGGEGINFHLIGDNGYERDLGGFLEPVSIDFPTTGTYRLRAASDGITTGGAYSFRVNQTLATSLQLGVPFSDLVPGSGFSQLFKVEINQVSPINIQFDAADATSSIGVYARMGSIPTRAAFDVANETSAPSKTLGIPSAAPGTLYILVYTESSLSPSNFTLLVDPVAVSIDSVSPNQFSAGESQATIIVNGLGFAPGSQVSLIPRAGEHEIAAQSISINQSTQITALFNLSAATIGDYDLRVTVPGASAVLQPAIKVAAAMQGKLKTKLILPQALGRNAPATIDVQYSNEGAAPLKASILVLKSADANISDLPLLTLNKNLVTGTKRTSTTSLPNGFTNSVQIYASGATPGLLMPGESIQIPVYYAGLQEPYDLNDTAIELAIGVHSAGDATALDWSANGDFKKPDWIASDVWPLVRANLQLQIGNTWGDYVKTLRRNAEYLNRFEKSFTDVTELYGFEIRNALGLDVVGSLTSAVDAQVVTAGIPLSFARSFGNTLSSRHQTGVFGRGWDASWQFRLEQLSDGTLIVHESADSQRRFQPYFNHLAGLYQSQPGDAGIMVSVNGGFELTETSGTITRYRGDGKLDYVQGRNNDRITPSYTGSLITKLTHSAGGSLTIVYNGAGRISSISDSAGNVTNYLYDATNTFLLSVSSQTGTTSYTYNPANGSASEFALKSITGPDGLSKHFDYDLRGRISATYLDFNAGRINFDYSQTGQIKATDLTGTFTRSFFDHTGLLVRREDSLGQYVVYQYNANRQLIQSTDDLGRSQSYERSDAGRPRNITDAFGRTILSLYNSGPNKLPTSSTDAKGNVTRYTYDATGNLLSTLYPDGTTESVTYDVDGNLKTIVNRRGQTIDRTLNSAGQVVRENLSDGTVRSYVYDSRGRLHSAADSESGTTTLDYDSADRLIKVAYPNGKWLEYLYDPAGRRTRIGNNAGFAINYEYNSSGQLARLRDAGNALIIEYSYDLAGRLVRENKANGTYTTFGYDSAGRQSSILHYTPLGVVNSRFLYTFNAAGLRDTETTIDGMWTYTYDLNDQLVRGVFASTSPSIPNQDLKYEYDALGNRTRTVLNGATTSYDANGMNQYTTAGGTTFLYDLDGNLAQENGPGGLKNYSYNQRNQLVRVETPLGIWQYEYDILNNRSASIFNGIRTDYLNDPIGLGNVVTADQTIGGSVHTVGYAYGLGLEASFSASSADFYDFDVVGSTAGLTDASGNYVNHYSYNPWGESLRQSETVSNPFEFVGQSGVMNEANGVHFMRARYYSSGQGRFISQDPLRLKAGDTNFYRYVGNEPVSRIDPSGLFAGFGGGGGIAGGGGSGGGGRGIAGGAGLAGIAGLAAGVAALTVDDDVIPPTRPFDGKCFVTDPCFSELVSFAVPVPQSIPLPKPPESNGDDGVVSVVNSIDPNEKLAAAGFGPQEFIQVDTVIPYRINFENLGPGSIPTPAVPATAPAQRVDVTDQLSTDLDWSTFEFSEFGFGDRIETVAAGKTYYFKTIEIEDGNKLFNVEVELDFNRNTGMMRAVFQSVDPLTSLPPDVLTGFLPPEDGSGIGKAHIDFKIKPKTNLASGTELRNVANIRFDYQTVISTNQVDPQNPLAGIDANKEALNTIDASAPISQVTTLPTVSPLNFPVAWSGSDVGSGVATYDVFVSDNGALFSLWLDDTANSSGTYHGLAGHTYRFYSIATDHVGLTEATTAIAQATTMVQSALKVAIGAPSLTDTAGGPVTYTVTYAAAASISLTAADVTLLKTGTANGTISLTGTGKTRTVKISNITGDGTLGISIAAGTAKDSSGNSAPASAPSKKFNVDNIAPTLSIGNPAKTATNGGQVTFTVTYSGASTVTLSAANVVLNKTGTANGTVEVIGTGMIRTVKISQITGNGTLGIAIAAGTAKDKAGNAALATTPSAMFSVDNIAPTILIGPPSLSETTNGPVTYTVTYAGASTISLIAANVRLIKSGTANGTISVSGTGNTRTVTISNTTGDGKLGIAINGDTARDGVGNKAVATGPSILFNVDNTLATKGLFAYWDFESDSLDKAPEGKVADHGKLTGATIVPGGLGNGSLRFSGPGQVMALDSSTDINERNIHQRTISLWFLPTQLSTPQRQVIYQEGSFVRGMNIYLENGRLFAGGWNTAAGWNGTWMANAGVLANQWNQIAFVFDSTTAQMQLHLNGTSPITTSVPTFIAGHFFATFGGAQQGSRFSDGNGGAVNVPGSFGDFSGFIDDARIYNRVLSNFEIKQLAASVLTLPASLSSNRSLLANPSTRVSKNGLVLDREDTNGDGTVSALDALKVINQVGRVTKFIKGESLTPEAARLDVNGDGLITALDALVVINKISRNNRAESVYQTTAKLKTLSETAVDEAFAGDGKAAPGSDLIFGFQAKFPGGGEGVRHR